MHTSLRRTDKLWVIWMTESGQMGPNTATISTESIPRANAGIRISVPPPLLLLLVCPSTLERRKRQHSVQTTILFEAHTQRLQRHTTNRSDKKKFVLRFRHCLFCPYLFRFSAWLRETGPHTDMPIGIPLVSLSGSSAPRIHPHSASWRAEKRKARYRLGKYS